jgi:hypothetical protein
MNRGFIKMQPKKDLSPVQSIKEDGLVSLDLPLDIELP